MRRLRIIATFAALALAGCGADRQTPSVEPAVAEEPAAPGPVARLESVRIEGVPHVVQKPLYCGEACAEMWLRKLGRDIDQDGVYAQSGLAPDRGRGAGTDGLKIALEALGFELGDVRYRFAPASADGELDRLFAEMHADLVAGVPSIIKMRTDPDEEESEHFRLVLGYDAADDEVIYHEPGDANGAYSPIERERLLELWPSRHAEDEWNVVRFRLAGGLAGGN